MTSLPLLLQIHMTIIFWPEFGSNSKEKKNYSVYQKMMAGRYSVYLSLNKFRLFEHECIEFVGSRSLLHDACRGQRLLLIKLI
jgi:hypothetical protein